MSRNEILKQFIERIKDDFYHETKGYADPFCIMCEVALDIAFKEVSDVLIGEEKTGAKNDQPTHAVDAGQIMKNYSDFAEPEYDSLHKDMCDICISELKKANLPADYGVAQMIINLATKYVFSDWFCGNDTHRLSFKSNYHFLLNPYSLRWLNCCGVDGKPKCLNRNTAWNKLTYKQYSEIQKYADKCVKTLFPDYSRIEVEFLVEEEVKLYDALKTIGIFEKIDSDNSILDSARGYFDENGKTKPHDFMEAINSK